MGKQHDMIPVLVWADVDRDIAQMVTYLNTIEGVRTHGSCQGTIGEGGAEPYGPFVDASWPPEQFERLSREFNVETRGECWGFIRPLPAPPAKAEGE